MTTEPTLLQRLVTDPLSFAEPVSLPSGEAAWARPLLPTDAVRLGVYFESLSAETRRRFGPHPLDAATARQLCVEIDPTHVLRWVAVAGDDLIAYFILMWSVTTHERDRYAARGVVLSGDVDCTFAPSVADRFQGQGLGSRLFDPLRSLARRAGRRHMVLLGGTQGTNARAIAYYTRLGFETLGSFEDPPGVPNLDMWLAC